MKHRQDRLQRILHNVNALRDSALWEDWSTDQRSFWSRRRNPRPSARWPLAVAMGALAFGALRYVWRHTYLFDFDQKAVFIMGGSRGLGLVIARECARQGAKLAISARDAAELDRAASELRAMGAEVLAIPCDVRDNAQVIETVRAIEAHYGQIDVLFNVAGAIIVGPAEAMTFEDYADTMDTHFWGALHTMTAVLPAMRARKDGHIVNIASIAGRVGVPHLVPYSASKAALVGLSTGMRAELSAAGVTVTTVCASLMTTGAQVNSFFKGRYQEEYAWFTLLDASPFVAVSAESAAVEIIRACKHGDPEIYVSLQGSVAARLAGLFPNLTAAVLAFSNRFLPATEGGTSERVRGIDAESPLAPPSLTEAADVAALQNNELEGEFTG